MQYFFLPPLHTYRKKLTVVSTRLDFLKILRLPACTHAQPYTKSLGFQFVFK